MRTFLLACAAAVAVVDGSAPSWQMAPPMRARRSEPAVAALGGAVYACGGTNYDGPGQSATHLASCERFDPPRNAWAAVADMSTPRVGGRAAALDGKLWVVGGITDAEIDMTCSMEVYDPAMGKWANSTPYPCGETAATGAGRAGGARGLLFHSMTAAHGLLVVVGITKDATQPSVATFNTTTREWTGWPAVNASGGALRLGAAAAALGADTVVALGGSSEMAAPMTVYASAQRLDVADGPSTRWAALPPMATARAFPAAAAAGGRVYAIGGQGAHGATDKLSSVEAFTPPHGERESGGGGGLGAWDPVPAMQFRRGGLGAAAVGGVIYAVGGVGGAPGQAIHDLASVEMLDTSEL